MKEMYAVSVMYCLKRLTCRIQSTLSLATFRSEYEIDYEYNIRISNQSRSQSPRNEIGVRYVDVYPVH